MICWTLIRHDRRNYNQGLSSNILKVLAIFVESAIIYTAWTIFFFITYQFQSNIQFFAIDVYPSMAGISFMLINVRVGLGWAKIAEPTVVTTGITAGSNMPMRPLAISISQVIEDSEGGGVETSHYSETSQYGERKPDGL